jgi:hypothetical protein
VPEAAAAVRDSSGRFHHLRDGAAPSLREAMRRSLLVFAMN